MCGIEPTGSFDSTNGEAVMELLRELQRGGATICMVTHDPRYALHAERAVHLFNGRVVEEAAVNGSTLTMDALWVSPESGDVPVVTSRNRLTPQQ